MRLMVLLSVVLLLAAPVLAYGPTPFVEGTKVGDERTATGWVVAMDPGPNTYYVLVLTDTELPVLIKAEADKGVIDTAALGQPASIKARVIERTGKNNVKIKILSMTLVKADKKAGT